MDDSLDLPARGMMSCARVGHTSLVLFPQKFRTAAKNPPTARPQNCILAAFALSTNHPRSPILLLRRAPLFFFFGQRVLLLCYLEATILPGCYVLVSSHH